MSTVSSQELTSRIATVFLQSPRQSAKTHVSLRFSSLCVGLKCYLNPFLSGWRSDVHSPHEREENNNDATDENCPRGKNREKLLSVIDHPSQSLA